MERSVFYKPKAEGKPKPDRIDIFISFFVPGKENAIKREKLLRRCIEAGIANSDRAMRKLIERVKVDYNIQITNECDGEGYYIPTQKESVQLARNNKREDKREPLETTRGIRLYLRIINMNAWKRW